MDGAASVANLKRRHSDVMKYLIPATCFLVSFLGGLSFWPHHDRLDSGAEGRAVVEEAGRNSQERTLPTGQVRPEGSQAVEASRSPASATPKPFHFSTAQEAAAMMKRLRQAGAPEAVMRALLVDGWLEWLADPAQQSASVEGVLRDLPVGERILFASSRLQALAHVAPQRFVEELTAMTPNAGSKLAQESLAEYTARDPASALSLAQRLGASGVRVGTDDIFRQWAIKDGNGAIAKAMSLPGVADQGSALSAARLGALIGDPDTAWASISLLPKDDMAALNLQMLQNAKPDIVQSLFADDSRASIAVSLGLGLFATICKDLFSAYAEAQPDKAVGDVSSRLAGAGFENPDFSRRAVAGVVEGYASHEPEKAYAYVADILQKYRPPILTSHAQVIAAVGSGIAAGKPELTQEGIGNAFKGGSRFSNSLAASISAAVAMRDAESLEEAVRSVPMSIPDSNRDLALKQILNTSYWGIDYSQRAEMVKEMHQPRLRLDAWDGSIATWVEVDAQAAFNWAGLHEKEYPGVTGIAMQAWASSDPYGVSQAIAEMPAGPGRDAYIPSLVASISIHDPASAVAWAVSVSDPALREEMLRSLVSRARVARRSLDTLLQAEGLDHSTADFIRQEWVNEP